MCTHQVYDGELKGYALKVIVQRHVAGVVAKRQIDRIHGGLNAREIADRTGQGPTPERAACCRALQVNIGWRSELRLEEVSRVIPERRRAERTVTPSKPRTVDQSGKRFDAVFSKPADGAEILMECVDDRPTRHLLDKAVQIIGAGHTDIPGAEIACVVIIAGVPVETLDLEEATVCCSRII